MSRKGSLKNDIKINISTTTEVENATNRLVTTNIGKKGTGGSDNLGKIKPIQEAYLLATSSPTRPGSPMSIILLPSFQCIDQNSVDCSRIKFGRKDKKRKIEGEYNSWMNPRGKALLHLTYPLLLYYARNASRPGKAVDER